MRHTELTVLPFVQEDEFAGEDNELSLGHGDSDVFMAHSGEVPERHLETWVWSSGEGSGDVDLGVMNLMGEK